MNNILPDSSMNHNNKDVLREFRANAFLENLAAKKFIFLDEKCLKEFSKDGWTRSQVETAINDLASTGQVKVSRDGLCLTLEPIRTSKSEVVK